MRFGYAVLAAEELVAVSNSLKFEYNDGRTFLAWAIGLKVDAAVWIGLFLVLVTLVNLFPVKVRATLHSCAAPPRAPCFRSDGWIHHSLTNSAWQYFGELEYAFGSLKLAFISMLIVLMVILDTMKRQY
jgi:amino acid transporter